MYARKTKGASCCLISFPVHGPKLGPFKDLLCTRSWCLCFGATIHCSAVFVDPFFALPARHPSSVVALTVLMAVLLVVEL